MEHRLSFGMWGPLSGAQGFLPQAQQLLCLQILRREAAEPHQPNPELCAAERPTLRAQNGSCVTCSALGTRHEAFRRRLPVLGPQGLVNTGSAHRGPEQPSTSRECREVLFAFQRFWQNQVSLPVTLITHTQAVFPSPPGTPSCSLRPAVKDQTPNHSLGHESFVSSSASEGSQRQLVSRQALTLHFCSESFPTKCTACSWCRESGLRKALALWGIGAASLAGLGVLGASHSQNVGLKANARSTQKEEAWAGLQTCLAQALRTYWGGWVGREGHQLRPRFHLPAGLDFGIAGPSST